MDSEPLAELLFPKARRAVLGLLLSHPDRAFYLREIVNLTGLGIGHLQREFERLTAAGILRRFEQGRHVYFQADEACPIHSELRGIVRKTVGVGDELRRALTGLKDRIRLAFVFGSVARGTENSASDVDLLIVGDVTLAAAVAAIHESESVLQRPVNPTVYSVQEFAAKRAAGQHFVTKVMSREKLWLIGDDDELAALSRKQVAPATRNIARRNRRTSCDRRP